MSRTLEHAVGGTTVGLMSLGDTVTWEAVHFGIRQRLTVKITQFDLPYLFVDEMVQGAFHSFTHIHEFRPDSAGTLMMDTFRYVAPLGIVGRVADLLFLESYMRTLLRHRALEIKRMAEASHPAQI